MAEGSETYVMLGSQSNTECSGCRELRKQVEGLRSMMRASRQTDDDDRYYSTHISERKQVEIDRMLLDAHHKVEAFQQAYEKAVQEKHELSKKLDEKESEVAVLKEQNTVYAADFQLERQDRERSQSRVIELEEQLAASSQRIADLEDEKQRLLTTVPTTRHHNPHVPVYRECVTEAGMMPVAAYPEHHPPAYSSVHHSPVITHHCRQPPRPYGRGYDVCDSVTDKSHLANVG